jgi:hypothetical protein
MEWPFQLSSLRLEQNLSCHLLLLTCPLWAPSMVEPLVKAQQLLLAQQLSLASQQRRSLGQRQRQEQQLCPVPQQPRPQQQLRRLDRPRLLADACGGVSRRVWNPTATTDIYNA